MTRTTRSTRLQKEMNTLWTTKDICDAYHVTAMTVCAWRSRGLPHVAIKGESRPSIRFVPAEATNWINAYLKRKEAK